MDYAERSYLDMSIDYINNDLKNMATCFLKLGAHLKEVRDLKHYELGGYKNVYDFALTEFNLSKSSVSRFINICYSFSKNHNSMVIDDKYKDYNYSQLCELLNCDDDLAKKINPGTSVKEIRKLKKCSIDHIDNEQLPGQIAISDYPNVIPEGVATSQQYELLGDDCILAFYNNHFSRYPKDLAKKRIKDNLKDVLIDTYGKPLCGGTLQGTDNFYDCKSDHIRFWFSNGHEDIKYTWSAFISRLFLLLPSDDLDQENYKPCMHWAGSSCNITGCSEVAKNCLDIDCPGTCCWNCNLSCGARCNSSSHNVSPGVEISFLEQRRLDLLELYKSVEKDFIKYDCLPDPGKKKKFKFGSYEMTIEYKEGV